jgi:FecR protein
MIARSYEARSMKTFLTIFIIGVCAMKSWAANPFDSAEPIATIHKPVGEVYYKTGDKDWQVAKVATPLYSGDRVKAGDNSFVIIKFIEGSIIRVQENSEVVIRGEKESNKEFSKNVHLDRGEVGFTVQHQENEKFEFSTPTSVASIRGTEGLLATSQDSNDVLILGAGVVVFTNIISNQSVTVGANQAATSQSNGTITVHEISPEQLERLRKSTNLGQGQGGQGSGGSGTSSNGNFKIGFSVSAPAVTEGEDLDVTVELTQLTVPIDTLKTLVSYYALAYKSDAAQTFTEVSAPLSGTSVKFHIPGANVVAPELKVYVIFRTTTGINLTFPPDDPQTKAISIVVQSKNGNEIRIPFTDPSGKQKTMVIDY